MIEITADSVKKSFKKALDERGGEYIYPSDYDRRGPACLYAKRDKAGNATPDCLVGFVFADHGIDMEPMIWEEGSYGPYSVGDARSVLGDMVMDNMVTVTREATSLLVAAQTCQDQGVTWGRSIEIALEEN